MKVAIRTDASIRIGSGHVMRCLTLADKLVQAGADVTFICRSLEGHLIGLIESRGFSVAALPAPSKQYDLHTSDPAHSSWLEVPWEKDAAETHAALSSRKVQYDWLISDHYGLDHKWEREIANMAVSTMVIDDLADRKHECDLLLDHNLTEDSSIKYEGLVKADCKQLIGPVFTLLRGEFQKMRKHLRRSFEDISTIAIFMGGADATPLTRWAIEAALANIRLDSVIHVILGPFKPDRDHLYAEYGQRSQVQIHEMVSNMAEMYGQADLAIGGAGMSTWERCCLGLPTLSIAMAEHQVLIGTAAHKARITEYLGRASDLSEDLMRSSLDAMIKDSSKRARMSEAGMKLVDGKGTQRVLEYLKQLTPERA